MKLKFLSIITAAFLVLLVVSSARAFAFDPFSGVCAKAPNSPTCQQKLAQQKKDTNPVVNIIHTAAGIIAAIGGIAAVIVIIISGFMFVTAGGASPGQRSGDPNRVKSARAALSGAIIGLIIIALAWTIVTFVTDRIIG